MITNITGWSMLAGLVLSCLAAGREEPPSPFKNASIEYEHFFNDDGRRRPAQPKANSTKMEKSGRPPLRPRQSAVRLRQRPAAKTQVPAAGTGAAGHRIHWYTLGALLEAQSVLEGARPEAVKAVFLITDGYSNGGDPRPAAKGLREQGVRVFTFGIRNGNVKELYDMSSESTQENSYIVDSLEELEALARCALHEDLQTGSYLAQSNRSSCDRLCKDQLDGCHATAQCTCGTHTGYYACLCPPGLYGTGLKDDCHRNYSPFSF